jgi:RNA polymerase sigma-70 factor (ECF subfamily)
MQRCALFCAVARDASPSPALEAALADAVAAGRRAWPSFQVDEEAFLRRLADVSAGADPAPALVALHAADLWLAFACAAGDPKALDAFAAAHLAQLATYLARIKAEALADDVRQILLTRFFVSDASSPPKILEYSGRGALAGWVRVAAVRTAIGLSRRTQHAQPTEDGALGDMVGSSDPELDAMKLELREAFERALADAFDALPPRDRVLLKLHYLDGMTVEALARLYRVHRVSASRWLSDARGSVLELTRSRLRARMALSDSEFASVTRLVQSQLDISLSRLLGRSGVAAGPLERDPSRSVR